MQSQILSHLELSGGKASLAEVVNSFEKPRSEKYLNQVLDELMIAGEISEEFIEGIGFDGRILTWEKMPQPEVVEAAKELWQCPPKIHLLVEANVWKYEMGPKPGIFADKSPPNVCSWSCRYTVAGFETVDELILPETLGQTQIWHEATDVLAMRLPHTRVYDLGILMASPRPWSINHENKVRTVLGELRQIYPQYQPHWLLEPWSVDGEMKYGLPMRVYGAPSFRRSWVPYDVSHNWAQPR